MSVRRLPRACFTAVKYNYFELKFNSPDDAQWTENKGFQPVDIFIDGRFLIDIIREAEEPVFAQEYFDDFLHSEDENDDDEPTLIPAGDYLSLPASLTFLPSRNLLGEEPYDWFEQTPDDMHWGKSVLLGCTCEIEGCWDLVAKISLTDSAVIWSRIGQFHREYEHDLEFVFERRQYEAQLRKIKF